jgi:hypothetical protein
MSWGSLTTLVLVSCACADTHVPSAVRNAIFFNQALIFLMVHEQAKDHD